MQSVSGRVVWLLVVLFFRPTVQQNTTNATACSGNPCRNGGVCTLVGDGFDCTCTGNFSGATCSCYNNSDCNVDSRQGICNPFFDASKPESVSNPTCLCAPGFHGERCHTDVDQCLHAVDATSESGNVVCKALPLSPPCIDRKDRPNTFSCDYCSPHANETACKNNGSCTLVESEGFFNECISGAGCFQIKRITERSFNCACPLHFAGRRCQQVLCSRSQNCSDHGECSPVYDYSHPTAQQPCVCDANYTGRQCEAEIIVMVTTLAPPSSSTTPTQLSSSTTPPEEPSLTTRPSSVSTAPPATLSPEPPPEPPSDVPIEDRLAVWADLFSAGMNAFELYKKNQCPRS